MAKKKYPFGAVNVGKHLKCIASKYNGRHLVLGSGDHGFKSWLLRMDVESLGKTIYMDVLISLLCRMSNQLQWTSAVTKSRVQRLNFVITKVSLQTRFYITCIISFSIISNVE